MKQFIVTMMSLVFLAACSVDANKTDGASGTLPTQGDSPNLKNELRHNSDTGKDEWIYFMKNFNSEKFFLAFENILEGALNLVEGNALATAETDGSGRTTYMCGDGSVGDSCGTRNGVEVVCCSGSWCTNSNTNTCSDAGQCADKPGLKCPFGYSCCGSGQPCVPWGQACGNSTNCTRDVQRCSNEANAKFQQCMRDAGNDSKKINACQDQLTRDTNACGDAYRRCMGEGGTSSSGNSTGLTQ